MTDEDRMTDETMDLLRRQALMLEQLQARTEEMSKELALRHDAYDELWRMFLERIEREDRQNDLDQRLMASVMAMLQSQLHLQTRAFGLLLGKLDVSLTTSDEKVLLVSVAEALEALVPVLQSRVASEND